MQRFLLSIVIPCFNEEESLPITFGALRQVEQRLDAVDTEYILVDDGSSDRTLQVMKELAESGRGVRYVSFSRNFGKEAAMYAGMEAAAGDYICILDGDMQDSPELLPQMLHIVAEEGYDSAAVRRVTRDGEPPIRSMFARMFYRAMGNLCKIDVVDGARDYRLMTRQMANSVLSLKEHNRYSKGIFSWVGYRTKWIECVNAKRAKGETKWSFWDLLFYAIDAMISFSTKPLALSSVLGLGLCGISFFSILFVIVRQLVWGQSAYGWSSLVCIILLLSGIQLFCIGVVGQYLAKMFSEVKRRPLYIVRETGRSGERNHE